MRGELGRVPDGHLRALSGRDRGGVRGEVGRKLRGEAERGRWEAREWCVA